MNGSMDFAAAPQVEDAAPTATPEQQDIRAKLEGLLEVNEPRTNSDAVPEQPNDANDLRTESRTNGTTQPQDFERFDFSPQAIAERFGGTTERTLFDAVQEGFTNGLAPNEIVKQSLKLGRERYQEGKALSLYLVRKYGDFNLLQHFRKWLEEA
jgi:hypothetical protein